MVDPVPPDAYTILIIPTHVGTNLRGGRSSPVARLTRKYAADAVLLTEIQAPIARARLALAFPTLRWCRSGTVPPSWGRGAAGTIALARRSRFRRLSTSGNRLVSKYLDRMHPERRTTWLDVLDKITDREARFIALHPWALGPNPPPQVRVGHDLQVDRYEQAAVGARKAGMQFVAGGDTNETGHGDGSTPIEKAMARAGGRNARPSGDHAERIIEAFVSNGLTVVRYKLLSPAETGADHVGIVLTVDPR